MLATSTPFNSLLLLLVDMHPLTEHAFHIYIYMLSDHPGPQNPHILAFNVTHFVFILRSMGKIQG